MQPWQVPSGEGCGAPCTAHSCGTCSSDTMDKYSRRVETLGAHITGALAPGSGPGGLGGEAWAPAPGPLAPNPTSAAPGVQGELQRLLEHDSHGERQRMKDLMRDPLFTP